MASGISWKTHPKKWFAAIYLNRKKNKSRLISVFLQIIKDGMQSEYQ